MHNLCPQSLHARLQGLRHERGLPTGVFVARAASADASVLWPFTRRRIVIPFNLPACWAALITAPRLPARGPWKYNLSTFFVASSVVNLSFSFVFGTFNRGVPQWHADDSQNAAARAMRGD